MDDRTLMVLEFDRIREMLAARASFQGGKELALALEPVNDLFLVKSAQDETTEARRFIDQSEAIPASGFTDIKELVDRGKRGGVLQGTDLLTLADTLMAARRLKKLIQRRSDDFPVLSAIAGKIGVFPGIEEEIARCIGTDGKVRDEASAELSDLRRRGTDLHARLRGVMEGFVHSPTTRSYLMDAIYTIRQDRYVLPVKQEYRSQVKGVAHDVSASGATVFIEPLAAVDLNNELLRVRVQEEAEVRRILARLSRLVGDSWQGLHETREALSHLDLALAKGSLSRDMGANEPLIDKDGRLDLLGARHPLLGQRAVPVDVRLGQDFDILVVTGPNTGGKTVTLKTVGLLVLMAAAGLHIPAERLSRVPLYPGIYADIGDEQSIEQNLSTFSSHMSNILRIGRDMPCGSLVLLDEIGAGTDPAEGAALAMALLEDFQRRGAQVIATTHYSELKYFAWSNKRMENASVEFDPRTLAPTFRLVIGVPGRSNALEIAGRLGFDDRLIGRARELLGMRHVEMESMLADLEKERRHATDEKREVERLRSELSNLRAQYERLVQDARSRREELLAEARAEARSILERARSEAREAIARLKLVAARQEHGNTPAAEALKEAESVRQGLNATRKAWAIQEVDAPAQGGAPNLPWKSARPAELRPGMRVMVRSIGLEGEVLEDPGSDGQVLVLVGAMRSRVPAGDLMVIDQPGTVTKKKVGRGSAHSVTREKAASVSTEIHLRRLTVDEALAQLDKYIDDAVLAGLDEVRIIHGKGTGTLRQAVVRYLKEHPQVVGYRPGDAAQGGLGVTVARLRPD